MSIITFPSETIFSQMDDLFGFAFTSRTCFGIYRGEPLGISADREQGLSHRGYPYAHVARSYL